MAWRNMDKEEVGRHSGTLYNLARSVIADRKANPRDPDEDPVSSLLAERTSDGEPLGEEELTGAVRQALVVGMVAPPILIGSIAKHLAEDVGLQDELRADPSLIPAAVEEFIRLYTPYRGFARTAACPVSMHGKTMSPSEPVAMVRHRSPCVAPPPRRLIQWHRPTQLRTATQRSLSDPTSSSSVARTSRSTSALATAATAASVRRSPSPLRCAAVLTRVEMDRHATGETGDPSRAQGAPAADVSDRVDRRRARVRAHARARHHILPAQACARLSGCCPLPCPTDSQPTPPAKAPARSRAPLPSPFPFPSLAISARHGLSVSRSCFLLVCVSEKQRARIVAVQEDACVDGRMGDWMSVGACVATGQNRKEKREEGECFLVRVC